MTDRTKRGQALLTLLNECAEAGRAACIARLAKSKENGEGAAYVEEWLHDSIQERKDSYVEAVASTPSLLSHDLSVGDFCEALARVAFETGYLNPKAKP